jgi:hypothetical protein
MFQTRPQRGDSVDLAATPSKEDGPGVWNKAAVKNIDDPTTMHIHNGTHVPQTLVLGWCNIV